MDEQLGGNGIMGAAGNLSGYGTIYGIQQLTGAAQNVPIQGTAVPGYPFNQQPYISFNPAAEDVEWLRQELAALRAEVVTTTAATRNAGAAKMPAHACACGAPTTAPGPQHMTTCSLWKAGR
jgi:hypothetical protein